MLGPVAQYDDTNDTSIVLRIDYGATSFLLTGDMESDAERDLVNSGANLEWMSCHRWATTAPARLHQLRLPERCPARDGHHLAASTISRPTPPRDLSILQGRCGRLPHRPWGRSPFPVIGQNYTVATEHFATDAGKMNPTDPAASSAAQQAAIGNVNSKKFHLPQLRQPPGREEPDLFSSYDEAGRWLQPPLKTASNKM